MCALGSAGESLIVLQQAAKKQTAHSPRPESGRLPIEEIQGYKSTTDAKTPGLTGRCCSLELGIHIPIHFHYFAARGRVDKVVPDDVRLREVVLRVPDIAQEFIEPGVHALSGCRIFQDVAAGLLPVDPEQMVASSMFLVLLARRVRNPDRALRRPVPLILALESERSPHPTGVLPAEREPGLSG